MFSLRHFIKKQLKTVCPNIEKLPKREQDIFFNYETRLLLKDLKIQSLTEKTN